MRDLSIESLLDHFEAVTRTNAGWRVRCPVHGDNVPSLDIKLTDDGAVLFFCRSRQCAFTDIVRAARLEGLNLGRPDACAGFSPFRSEPTRRSSGTDRTYSTDEIRFAEPWKGQGLSFRDLYRYTDAQGNPLFAVVRLTDYAGKKAFRQVRVAGPERWRVGLDGVEPVLYHLPQILKASASGETVYVAEGEKDVHSLEAWGLAATTNPMGAGKWHDRYTQAMAGATRVVLLPDNDDVGKRHMEEAAHSLHKRGIVVHVVALSGLPPKGDVTDWIAAGKTRADLEAAIEQSVPFAAGSDENAAKPRRCPSPPPFPLIALPEPVASFVREAAQAFQCPIDYIGVPLLAVASAAIGFSRVIKLREGWVEACRIFAAVVAPPGSTKTPALAHVMNPLHELQLERDEAHRQSVEEYEIELAQFEGERTRRRGPGADHRKPQAPVPPCLLTTDATREALGELLSRNRRGLLMYADELTGWVRGMNQYKGGAGNDRQFFLSIWSGQPLYVHRKSAPPVHVFNPFLSVVGCIPPDMLNDLADGRGREDGFLHRILFAFPDPPRPGTWSEAELTSAMVSRWALAIRKLSQLQPSANGGPVILEFTPAGKRAWVLLFNEHRDSRSAPELPAQLMGPLAKLENYAARLTLIIHLLREVCGDPSDRGVDDESVAAGWALADYFAAHAERVYPRVHADRSDRKVEQVVSWVRRRGGECTARELLTHEVAGVKRATDSTRLMQEVVERGWARLEDRKASNGRGVTYLVLANE